MKAGTPNQPQAQFARLLPLMAAAILLSALPGCNKGVFSKAEGKASGLTCEAGVGIVDNEPDAGVNVTITVKNVGESGFINIRPELSTSEGEWSQSQDLHFDAGETQNLTYFFAEPTINARNIQCRIGISPDADAE
jgi:hypothetical protein